MILTRHEWDVLEWIASQADDGVAMEKMSANGYATRRAVKTLIEDGLVKMNGEEVIVLTERGRAMTRANGR